MPERQIVLDTETTGLYVDKGDRLIEVAAMEMQGRRPTRNTLHHYVNPPTAVSAGAFKVHGMSNAFLADYPAFEKIAPTLWSFLHGATLIIHNAPFDLGFLNHEFSLWRGEPVSLEAHCTIIDTLTLARKKHPRQKNTLDALCRRYKIDNSARKQHSALLDTQLLMDTFLAMTTQQASLFDKRDEMPPTQTIATHRTPTASETTDTPMPPLSTRHSTATTSAQKTDVVYTPDPQEIAAHQDFLRTLAKKHPQASPPLEW